MRNTKDWYLFLDRLLTNGKRLYLYLDRKFYTTDDALITGIKAILAEEYSRELSKKIVNAHRHRQTRGGRVMLTNQVLGFEKRWGQESGRPVDLSGRHCSGNCGCRAVGWYYFGCRLQY